MEMIITLMVKKHTDQTQTWRKRKRARSADVYLRRRAPNAVHYFNFGPSENVLTTMDSLIFVTSTSVLIRRKEAASSVSNHFKLLIAPSSSSFVGREAYAALGLVTDAGLALILKQALSEC